MAEYLNLRIPIITLRVLLIAWTTVSISFTLLLPLACLSFNYFYNKLIPIPSISLSFDDFSLNHPTGTGPFIVFSDLSSPPQSHQGNIPQAVKGLEQLDKTLHYDFNLKISLLCMDYESPRYATTMYQVTLMSSELFQMLDPYNPYDMDTESHDAKWYANNYGWSITQDLDSVSPDLLASGLYTSRKNTLVWDCQRKKKSIKTFAPPLLQGFIPEVVGEWEYSTNSHTINLLKDIKLGNFLPDGKSLCVTLEFRRELVIDPKTSVLEISVSWSGIRHYLYHYRTLSYVFGVLLLWSLSTAVLFSTIGGLVAWRELSTEHEGESKEDLPILMTGNADEGFEGRTEDFDFTVDVCEETTTSG